MPKSKLLKMGSKLLTKLSSAALVGMAGYELGENHVENKLNELEARKIEAKPVYSVTEIVVPIVLIIVLIFILSLIREICFKSRRNTYEPSIQYIARQTRVNIPSTINEPAHE